MHKVLERQVRRHMGAAAVPGLEAFLAAVDATYRGMDEDRRLLERSLELTSRELLDRNARLQEVDRMRSRFLNTAAHELGTPLTPIGLQLALLRRSLETGDVERSLRSLAILERSAARLNRIVADLLQAARLQEGHLRLDRRRFDLVGTVEEAMDAYRDVCSAAGIRLERTGVPNLVVEGDEGRIGQVVDNLLSNAVKFTPGGGLLRVSVERTEGGAEVRVTDTGIGIARTDLDRLFRPFSQVHDPQLHLQGGTGLGLYVARGILEAHGGSLGADSVGVGKGSAFWFTLPLEAEQALEPRPDVPPLAA